MSKVLQWMTMTAAANKPEYIFNIALSSLNMDRLKHKSLLFGYVAIQKGKYEFLNDLAEQLQTIKESIDAANIEILAKEDAILEG